MCSTCSGARAVPRRNQEQIAHHRRSRPTGDVGATVVASGPFPSAGNPVVIVTSDGGLRLFFAGSPVPTRRSTACCPPAPSPTGRPGPPTASPRLVDHERDPEGVGAGLRVRRNARVHVRVQLRPRSARRSRPGDAGHRPSPRYFVLCVPPEPRVHQGRLGRARVVPERRRARSEPGPSRSRRPIGTKVLAPGSVASDGKAVAPVTAHADRHAHRHRGRVPRVLRRLPDVHRRCCCGRWARRRPSPWRRGTRRRGRERRRPDPEGPPSG